MLRRIVALTRHVESSKSWSVAPAVYGDENVRTLIAQDCGIEGVACVDDAARAYELLAELADVTSLPWAEELAAGYLEFVLSMLDEDGLFVNFILDWDGTKNLDGPTSRPDAASWWQARGVAALARAWRLSGDRRVGDALRKSFDQIEDTAVASDLRCIHALAAIDLLRAPLTGLSVESRLRRWCEEIAASQQDGILLNAPAEEHADPREIHLWGHQQEGVLALAGVLLDRPDWIDAAETSAEALLRPVVESSFGEETSIAYDVSSVVFSLDCLHETTEKKEYMKLASEARKWFDGRNSAGSPTYDRERGRVADGVDIDLVNPHSGAESNIMAGLALFHELVESLTPVPDMMIDVRSESAGGRQPAESSSTEDSDTLVDTF